MIDTSTLLNLALKRTFPNRDAVINVLRELKSIENLPENKGNKSDELQKTILMEMKNKYSSNSNEVKVIEQFIRLLS
jgi:hypothetical protein